MMRKFPTMKSGWRMDCGATKERGGEEQGEEQSK